MYRPDSDLLEVHHLSAEEIAIFSVPAEGIRRWDDEALVYDVRVSDQQILRHYSFANRWFQVNCSLNLDGSFLTEHRRGYTWSFNCDICIPHYTAAGHVYQMDLWLDVLVEADGRTDVIKDEDEFADAVRDGLLTADEAAGARQGLDELISIIQGPGLVNFLESVCPFRDVAVERRQPPMRSLSTDADPLLAPESRTRYRTKEAARS